MMKRVLILILLLALLCPSALASTAADIAADYERALLGEWECVYSDISYFDAGDTVAYELEGSFRRSRLFVGASASGEAYMYLTDDNTVYMELGEVTFSADGRTFILYKGGSMAVFRRPD